MKTVAEQVIGVLKKKGLEVQVFTAYHFRVANRFDIFPNDRCGRSWKWFDLLAQERGVKPPEQFASFIPHFFEQNPPPKPAIVPMEKGWWFCPFPGCEFKTRDDMTSDCAREQREHLESHE